MTGPADSARDLLNRLAFGFRSRLSWGRLYAERGPADFSFVPPNWKDLAARYGLDALQGKLDAHSLLLNLAKLDQLEALAKSANLQLPLRPLQVLDIGSQSFVYAPALSLFFARCGVARPRTVELTGIEIDAYRRRWSLHTRRDLARYYASLVPWTVYRVGDFLDAEFPRRFDVITWFRPHIAQEPLLAGGLPRRLHRPAEQMRKALDLLEPGGALFLSYQSQAEAEMAGELFASAGGRASPLRSWNAPQGAVEKRAQWLQIVSR